jgi:hypothetical protein
MNRSDNHLTVVTFHGELAQLEHMFMSLVISARDDYESRERSPDSGRTSKFHQNENNSGRVWTKIKFIQNLSAWTTTQNTTRTCSLFSKMARSDLKCSLISTHSAVFFQAALDEITSALSASKRHWLTSKALCHFAYFTVPLQALVSSPISACLLLLSSPFEAENKI